MHERKAKEFVRGFLQKECFSVAEIERSDKQTPDFIFSDEMDTYLLELKQKQSDPREGEKLSVDEETGWNVYVTADSTGRRNRFAAIISKAVEQMKAVCAPGDPFRLVWFFGEGPDAAFYEEQLVATIYGIKDVVWVAEGQTHLTTVQCLYADYAEFETHKSYLDGVIASDREGLLLYLNNRSPRFDRIRESRLVKVLGDAVYDPVKMEAWHQHLLLDSLCGIPGEEEINAIIADKYQGRVVKLLNFNRHYAEVHVPLGEEEL